MAITGVDEKVGAFLGRERAKRLCDGFDKGIECSGSVLAQECDLSFAIACSMGLKSGE
jgi:hypothetical protein